MDLSGYSRDELEQIAANSGNFYLDALAALGHAAEVERFLAMHAAVDAVRLAQEGLYDHEAERGFLDPVPLVAGVSEEVYGGTKRAREAMRAAIATYEREVITPLRVLYGHSTGGLD